MRVLHVTPHLGGGVGKAHAALTKVLPKNVQQTFVLLEEPREVRYAEAIRASGGEVFVSGLDEIASRAEAADIVQFEFWNHPRLFECLARGTFPAMRTAFWSHISGLFLPVIPPGLIEQAHRFVFTTEASLSKPCTSLESVTRRKIAAINSGFGLEDAGRLDGVGAAIAYLGTVDFIKMHPGFFDAVDMLAGDDIRVSVWGHVDAEGPVAKAAAAMRHPERIRFRGQTMNPAAALAEAGIFFYPLQRKHYGTAENALVEAMSLGLAPVVLDNPAEMAIVRDGETGLISQSIEGCASALQKLLSSAELRQKLGSNAAADVARLRSPELAARNFVDLWRGMLGEPATRHDFQRVIGTTPGQWFLATQCLPGEAWHGAGRQNPAQPSKGTLSHFLDVFPGDASLSPFSDARTPA